jgi:hypothetical protein
MTKGDATAICLGCVLAMMMHFVITFGISFAIAHLVVRMGLLNVGVGRLALLIWLVKLLMFNYNANVNTRKHE